MRWRCLTRCWIWSTPPTPTTFRGCGRALRTGLAVSRAGDWFGSPVNLASRVTGVARPGSVLVSESAREAIGDDERFTWSFAGSRRLKGIKDDVKLFRARRPDDTNPPVVDR